jgi:ABC-type dipeptide/oligopeptide/nickel transport system ATPase component
MKRITNIYIENFKAYKDGIHISLPDGENMLLYGENGSGKSSLFSGIMYFFDKSNNLHLKPQVNIYSGNASSKVRMVFKDVDNDAEEEYYASESELPADSKFSPFIKVSDLTKGFLDYRDLLSLYLNREDNANLFDVFIKLIGNMANPASRDTRTINQKIDSFYNKLKSVKIRRGKKYNDAIQSLLSIDNEIKSSLNQYFLTLNTFLAGYFPDLRVKLSYTISNLTLPSKGQISNAKIQSLLCLKVEKDGTQLQNYTHILNEARLSAIGICIYLSALKNSPQNIDYKILFLDDIFIGLDMGNRIPILNILRHEFSDYQIVISTYDRGWYNMARRILSSGHVGKWRFVEIFAGEESLADGRVITKPIITSGDDNLSRARKYLHDPTLFDYPASANYFRKCLEQLLSESFPKSIFRDENGELLEKYKLTKILNRSLKYCNSIPNFSIKLPQIIAELTTLQGMLSSLLHPLSHYDSNSPIYKHELIQIENAVVNLSKILPNIDFKHNLKLLIEKGDFLRLNLFGASGWIYKYQIELEDNLYLYFDMRGKRTLSLAKCYICEMSGLDCKKQTLKPSKISKSSDLYSILSYRNLESLVDSTIIFLESSKNISDIIKKKTYTEYLDYYKDAETLIPLSNLL